MRGSCQFHDFRKARTVMKTFSTSCGWSLVSKYDRTPYWMKQWWKNNVVSFFIYCFCATEHSCQFWMILSVSTIANWFPSLFLGIGPNLPMGTDSGDRASGTTVIFIKVSFVQIIFCRINLVRLSYKRVLLYAVTFFAHQVVHPIFWMSVILVEFDKGFTSAGNKVGTTCRSVPWTGDLENTKLTQSKWGSDFEFWIVLAASILLACNVFSQYLSELWEFFRYRILIMSLRWKHDFNCGFWSSDFVITVLRKTVYCSLSELSSFFHCINSAYRQLGDLVFYWGTVCFPCCLPRQYILHYTSVPACWTICTSRLNSQGFHHARLPVTFVWFEIHRILSWSSALKIVLSQECRSRSKITQRL